ncbi:MAG: hypothetical protein HY706_03585 [Candidatus Hydrogenedentes bacterium]|nr:hypothetical protein [Candidatus Hydrogenedentota bacterium]
MATRRWSESDLYGPVRDYLVRRGYAVRGEVEGCDLTATKGEDLIIVEMKRHLSTALLVQAVDRQRMADSVYIAVPASDKNGWKNGWKGVRRLLRKLELGLIQVDFGRSTARVEVLLHPMPYRARRDARRRRAILDEAAGRSSDYNQGGVTRQKLMTAYREAAIHIACCLEQHGPLSPRQLRALNTSPKTTSILYDNYYGWFERVRRGIYALSPRGKEELGKYSDFVSHYKNRTR